MTSEKLYKLRQRLLALTLAKNFFVQHEPNETLAEIIDVELSELIDEYSSAVASGEQQQFKETFAAIYASKLP